MEFNFRILKHLLKIIVFSKKLKNHIFFVKNNQNFILQTLQLKLNAFLKLNQIHKISKFSFQLQILDFSYNNFSQIPTGLSQFVGLRVLNFSANPISRIRSGDFRLPVLQIIVIEYCQRLKLIESKSFVEMPNIQTVHIRHNPQLVFISQNAFVNNNAIYE